LGFVAAYLAVWTVFGVAAYAVYRPHGPVAAGIVAIAAGLYELTPLKRHARRRCQQRVRSGWHLGLYCIGSSVALMLLLLAVGAMNPAWMSVIAVLVLVQKLLTPRAAVDVPVALAIVAFGLVVLLAPSSVPGLVPSM
jgi:predicted metal-binding membrane protein